jgi:DNA polymerase I-like protein with 3'-5' exonuclease and polymerase domains
MTCKKSAVRLPDGYAVIDLETTSSKDRELRAVDGREIFLSGLQEADRQYIQEKQLTIMEPFRVIAGHNIKFDLEHLLRAKKGHEGAWRNKNYDETRGDATNDLWGLIKEKAVVLDTQFITYLHSGHTELFPTLERACEYWGVPIRKTIDLSVELPLVNWDISAIVDLDEYLANDLEMTSALLMKQLEDPWVKANFPWIIQMHDGLAGTFEIEYNGMHVDPTRLTELTRNTTLKLSTVEAYIKAQAITSSTNPIVGDLFEPASNDHIAALLFGGDLELEERLPNGVFMTGEKAGMPRYKIERHIVSFPPIYTADPSWRTKTGKWSVNDEVLSSFPHSPLVEYIRDHRELAKLNGTYLDGLRKHLRVYDKSYYVFPQINLCATTTGRTSSSKPNMQNNPTHDSVGVASIYTSRFSHDSGILLEVDFKQIEILALAILSGDKVLRDDILSGRDIHDETGKLVYGTAMTKEERRVVKTINFGLIYGGGAETLSRQAGVSVGIAKMLIKAFYTRYKGVKAYFEAFKALIQELNASRGTTTGRLLANGEQQKIYIHESATGRRYGFKSYFSDYSKTVEVSHTETRNYPIQGLATGDLVLSALGVIWRKVLPKYGDDVKIVGLVHDSLRFDLKVDRLDELLLDLKYELEAAGEHLNKVCPYLGWDLPVKVTFSKGTDFFNMTEFAYP